jgi:hypothetical protein
LIAPLDRPAAFVDSPAMEIYRYGWVAWIWRLLAGAGVAAALALAWLAWREGSWAVLGIALPLAMPGLVLGPMVAVRIRQLDDGHIVVHTLAFWRRRIARVRLGNPRLKVYAQATVGGVNAPRIWVPVKGGLPLHVDLLGHIPDRVAFRRVFGVPANWL